MAWANDGTTIARIQNFFEFRGMLYCNERVNGLYRRTAPATWTRQPMLPATPAFAQRTKEWNGYLWSQDTNRIYRSSDGINWVLDFDAGAVWGIALWPWGFGGTGDYLYWSWCDSGTLETKFCRRNKAGIWINNVLAPISVGACTATWAGWDLTTYKGDVFFARRPNGWWWDGTVWNRTDVGMRQFLVHGGLLFGMCKDATDRTAIYRWRFDEWLLEETLGQVGPSNDEWGYMSLGTDGHIYVCTGLTDVFIWKRMAGGSWIITGKDTVGAGAAGAMYFNGDYFHGNNTEPNPNVRLFVPDFNVSVSGLYPQAMDVDGDGDALYIGLIDNATTFPVLVKVPLPLVPTAMGAEVYTGTDGTAINVECPNVGQRVVIAGNFGMNEQVEVSEDGGVTWVDIDRDAWGAETAQPLLVDPDTVDEVMVALQTAQAITETDDGGATAWTVNNAAVGYGVSAMARMPDGDELIIGDAHAVRKVEYSPNRGVTLADITGGVAIGDVVALEVA